MFQGFRGAPLLPLILSTASVVTYVHDYDALHNFCQQINSAHSAIYGAQ